MMELLISISSKHQRSINSLAPVIMSTTTSRL